MSSHATSPPDDPPTPRHIPLQGAFNFRDIGGYETTGGRRVRWRRIYRSGQLSKLTDADIDTLAKRRVLTIVDLREKEEYESAPDRLPPGARLIRCAGAEANPLQPLVHLLDGASSGVPFMTAFYSDIHGLASRFKPFFQTLLDLPADHALLLHCMAGKDRTGAGIALLLSALGVPRATILEDYLLSNTYSVKEFSKDQKHLTPTGLPAPVERDLLAAREEYLAAFFSTLEKQHGSTGQFLAHAAGLSPEKITRLRDMLTE